MANPNVKEFTDQNFEQEVLQASEPVLVDFWAEWCAPCRAIAPTIDKLATDYVGKAKIGKVDVEAQRGLAARFRIEAIPTLMIFHKGQVAQVLRGARGERELRQALDGLAK